MAWTKTRRKPASLSIQLKHWDQLSLTERLGLVNVIHTVARSRGDRPTQFARAFCELKVWPDTWLQVFFLFSNETIEEIQQEVQKMVQQGLQEQR